MPKGLIVLTNARSAVAVLMRVHSLDYTMKIMDCPANRVFNRWVRDVLIYLHRESNGWFTADCIETLLNLDADNCYRRQNDGCADSETTLAAYYLGDQMAYYTVGEYKFSSPENLSRDKAI